MNRNLKNGAPAEASDKQLKSLMSSLLRRSQKDKKLLVYQLLRNLLGKNPEEEVWIYDEQGRLYGHFLPPSLRAELSALEDPAFAAELERRTRAAGPTTPLKDTVKRLKSAGA
jgi:hypothetical protein